MRREEYWAFRFSIESQDAAKLVDYDQAEDLFENIVRWVEANGLQIGGGFRGPSKEDNTLGPGRETIIVVLPIHPTIDEFERALERFELRKSPNSSLEGPQWLVRSEGTVYLEFDQDFDAYLPEDLRQLGELLGSRPVSLVSIDFGDEREVKQLAEEIASALITAFEGIVDPSS